MSGKLFRALNGNLQICIQNAAFCTKMCAGVLSHTSYKIYFSCYRFRKNETNFSVFSSLKKFPRVTVAVTPASPPIRPHESTKLPNCWSKYHLSGLTSPKIFRPCWATLCMFTVGRRVFHRPKSRGSRVEPEHPAITNP